MLPVWAIVLIIYASGVVIRIFVRIFDIAIDTYLDIDRIPEFNPKGYHLFTRAILWWLELFILLVSLFQRDHEGAQKSHLPQ